MRAYSQEYNSIKGQSFIDGINDVFPVLQGEVDLSDGTMDKITDINLSFEAVHKVPKGDLLLEV